MRVYNVGIGMDMRSLPRKRFLQGREKPVILFRQRRSAGERSEGFGRDEVVAASVLKHHLQ